MYSALRYVKNDDKTDKQVFVGGINCSKQNAYAEMIAVQKRFGMKGKVVAYHGIQSFRTGEVTPEEAFEIGKETARRMWSDRYQVLVTVHVNTQNLHCHFVLNPCSFKDGQKFKNKIGDHLELREVSDEVCREYGKSVLENSNFYSRSKKKEYWVHKNGQLTHRDMLKKDIEYCLKTANDWEKFEKQLYGLGYTIDWTRMSVKGKGWERAVRLKNIGYTEDVIRKRLESNNRQGWAFVRDVWNVNLPKKNKSVLLSYFANELEFSIEHTHDVTEIYIDLLFLVLIYAFQVMKEVKDMVIMSVELRHCAKDLTQYIHDYNFLRETKIRTIPQLDKYIETTQTIIKEFEHERNLLRNKVRRKMNSEVLAENKKLRSEITNKHIEPLRKNLKRALKIQEKSPYLYGLLKQELAMEAPYRKIDRNGKVVFNNASERGAR